MLEGLGQSSDDIIQNFSPLNIGDRLINSFTPQIGPSDVLAGGVGLVDDAGADLISKVVAAIHVNGRKALGLKPDNDALQELGMEDTDAVKVPAGLPKKPRDPEQENSR